MSGDDGDTGQLSATLMGHNYAEQQEGTKKDSDFSVLESGLLEFMSWKWNENGHSACDVSLGFESEKTVCGKGC